MGRVSRLSGAILVETEGIHYLVGDLKEPCDFAAAGFENPGEVSPLKKRALKLIPIANSAPSGLVMRKPVLEIEMNGEELAGVLSRRLTIERNGSVSERLWSLIVEAEEYEDEEVIDATWLVRMPDEIWDVVRDSVLKCR